MQQKEQLSTYISGFRWCVYDAGGALMGTLSRQCVGLVPATVCWTVDVVVLVESIVRAYDEGVPAAGEAIVIWPGR